MYRSYTPLEKQERLKNRKKIAKLRYNSGKTVNWLADIFGHQRLWWTNMEKRGVTDADFESIQRRIDAALSESEIRKNGKVQEHDPGQGLLPGFDNTAKPGAIHVIEHLSSTLTGENAYTCPDKYSLIEWMPEGGFRFHQIAQSERKIHLEQEIDALKDQLALTQQELTELRQWKNTLKSVLAE